MKYDMVLIDDRVGKIVADYLGGAEVSLTIEFMVSVPWWIVSYCQKGSHLPGINDVTFQCHCIYIEGSKIIRVLHTNKHKSMYYMPLVHTPVTTQFRQLNNGNNGRAILWQFE